MADNEMHRLVTRSDFDGLVCAVLLKELGMTDEIQFVHPRDMQEGKTEITGRDITTNLPYAEGVHLAFDHHMSETHRAASHENLIIDAEAPSASRVLYRHYGGASRFPEFTAEMLAAVDRADAAATPSKRSWRTSTSPNGQAAISCWRSRSRSRFSGAPRSAAGSW